MTSLELTTWSGVSKEYGPFLLMFGSINTTPTPDEMVFSLVAPSGKEMAKGLCVYESASSFDVVDNGEADLIPGDDDANCDYAIASDILTITSGTYVLKAALV